jgi:hypothetical protein
VRQAGGGGVAGQGEERDEASVERSWSWLQCAEEDDEWRQRGDKVGRFVGPTHMWCAFKAEGSFSARWTHPAVRAAPAGPGR